MSIPAAFASQIPGPVAGLPPVVASGSLGFRHRVFFPFDRRPGRARKGTLLTGIRLSGVSDGNHFLMHGTRDHAFERVYTNTTDNPAYFRCPSSFSVSSPHRPRPASSFPFGPAHASTPLLRNTRKTGRVRAAAGMLVPSVYWRRGTAPFALLRNTRKLWPPNRGWTGGFLHFLTPRPAALALHNELVAASSVDLYAELRSGPAQTMRCINRILFRRFSEAPRAR